MRTQIISADDLRRNFGEVKKKLPYVEFIITDRGKQIALLSATPEMKRERLLKFAGAWKGTDLDNDDLWKDVLKRKSRKTDISL
jgi:antitoxin (DNA-binding transcriptional repressor) of toxin-antitoxin stability system